ncbi:MAG TPA: response regulator transcription factor [Thermoanaerobaculia bacterium]|jgi:two-component system KDP operon response regulator KdpE|nr:response regulator transcription factor [Thermoanaerobaculia bacterium]MDI9632356.1 response regulator transcription factor [Acidobacteriota bacterium]OQC41151.1 MAG: KDP operon transcriptional regulatory protein KdpE [Acidobacteria bacterium ADurb.Bin051]MBP7813742.1 response regulator transcription factor [Thermoanaerobaculia bacterium]MBP8845773.1 response regulator transcription factor [Thermoanaerobaculia bacterium]
MPRRPRLLVVDDDPAIREGLCEELEAAGYDTLAAADGERARELFLAEEPDLVLTDLAMPRLDGFGLVRAIRRTHRTPVLVLSVRGGESDKIRALDLGADDYVTKPFSVPELLARVRTQLRRAAPPSSRLRFPDLEIDLDRRRVRQGEREIHLTPTELAILEVLARNAGRPVSARQLIAKIWGAEEASADTVRVHVGSLRRKLEPDPSAPRYLVTEPWVGYRFLAEPIE